MPEEPQVAETPDVVVPAQPTAPQATVQQPVPEPVRRTRISAVWVAIGCFAVVLLFALLFVLQNSHSVDISYFGAHGHLPLGVALLLAGLCGMLLVGLAGTARILQLRAAHRRQLKS
jgi:uncharacterized integral membrane protein